MQLILSKDCPDDIVIATGVAHSVRDLCEAVFTRLNLDYREFVKQDQRYMRPQELDYLCGDATRAKAELKWEPEFDFDSLVDDILEHWLSELED